MKPLATISIKLFKPWTPRLELTGSELDLVKAMVLEMQSSQRFAIIVQAATKAYLDTKKENNGKR